MNTVVKVGENEVILSGVYIIPITTPYISIYMPERDFTFKISFEEASEELSSNVKFNRLKLNKAEPNIADVTFLYKENEKNFKSTRSPNNLFSSYRTENGVSYKTKHSFNIDFSVDRKNSIELKIQITKSPEIIDDEDNDDE